MTTSVNSSVNCLFNKGWSLFETGDYYQAHVTWEHIWKTGGEDVRKNIKGFIQLSGGVIKSSHGHIQAAEYLFSRAQDNLKNSRGLSSVKLTDLLVKKIQKVLENRSQISAVSKTAYFIH